MYLNLCKVYSLKFEKEKAPCGLIRLSRIPQPILNGTNPLRRRSLTLATPQKSFVCVF